MLKDIRIVFKMYIVVILFCKNNRMTSIGDSVYRNSNHQLHLRVLCRTSKIGQSFSLKMKTNIINRVAISGWQSIYTQQHGFGFGKQYNYCTNYIGLGYIPNEDFEMARHTLNIPNETSRSLYHVFIRRSFLILKWMLVILLFVKTDVMSFRVLSWVIFGFIKWNYSWLIITQEDRRLTELVNIIRTLKQALTEVWENDH